MPSGLRGPLARECVRPVLHPWSDRSGCCRPSRNHTARSCGTCVRSCRGRRCATRACWGATSGTSTRTWWTSSKVRRCFRACQGERDCALGRHDNTAALELRVRARRAGKVRAPKDGLRWSLLPALLALSATSARASAVAAAAASAKGASLGRAASKQPAPLPARGASTADAYMLVLDELSLAWQQAAARALKSPAVLEALQPSGSDARGSFLACLAASAPAGAGGVAPGQADAGAAWGAVASLALHSPLKAALKGDLGRDQGAGAGAAAEGGAWGDRSTWPAAFASALRSS